MKNKKIYSKNLIKKVALGAAVFLSFCLILVGFDIVYAKIYQNKIYHGLTIGNIGLGDKDKEEAKNIFQEKITQIKSTGFIFKTDQQKIVILPSISSLTDPDLSYELVTFDAKENIDQLYDLGRNNNFLDNLYFKIKSLFLKTKIKPIYHLNEQEFLEILKENTASFENPAINAHLKFEASQPFISQDFKGMIFDYQNALDQMILNLNNLETNEINLNKKIDLPIITKQEAEKLLPQVQELLTNLPVTLTFVTQDRRGWTKEYRWQVTQEEMKKWLDIVSNKNNKPDLGFNPVLAQEFFSTPTETINQLVQEAKFKIKDGKVTEFQASRDGQELDLEKSLKKIKQDFIIDGQKEIELVVKSTSAKVTTGDINDFGIREIIGIGTSNFAGSPKNRRHNIKIGAKTLNGTLIKPEEEFSLNTTLGKIDASTGYLPELVIRGNRTVPEYGGGLCQIGTTMFRVALDSGLPITERQNHSFRVRYYEPAGTDATIYPPHPDLKFINDTGRHLLLQTKIEGDDLIFELWGTIDGRITTSTKPIIYNYIAPPPTQVIETEEFSPGEKKCTEHAVTGATTEFTYRVEYPNGEIKEQIFKSIYKPWQEVCLIGVKPSQKATSTDENL